MEIGSEFHSEKMCSGTGIHFPRDGELTFCGRTAIEAVLKKLPKIKTALLPSYCCDSMVEPFRRAGISVYFFNVNYKNGLVFEIDGNADVLLWCNYFGFKYEMPDFDGIIIEDITHSLLSKFSHHQRSDYLVASVRKWEPIYCGGYCSTSADLKEPPAEFVKNKSTAMNLKSTYLNDFDEDKKTEFLLTFKKSNAWLAENYSELGIDLYSKTYISCVDVLKQREIRRKNAHILYEGLKGRVEFLFDEEQMDCPLFVPVILHECRGEVQKYLAKNKVYCPIHWPRPNEAPVSNLYDTELSLICDQRYNENDMERIVSLLLHKL